MKAGYARVSTKDQTVDLQVDALKKAGCTKVYTEVMNGTRATPQGRLIFNLFASLSEFERDVIRERTQAGLISSPRPRAQGRQT